MSDETKRKVTKIPLWGGRGGISILIILIWSDVSAIRKDVNEQKTIVATRLARIEQFLGIGNSTTNQVANYGNR